MPGSIISQEVFKGIFLRGRNDRIIIRQVFDDIRIGDMKAAQNIILIEFHFIVVIFIPAEDHDTGIVQPAPFAVVVRVLAGDVLRVLSAGNIVQIHFLQGNLAQGIVRFFLPALWSSPTIPREFPLRSGCSPARRPGAHSLPRPLSHPWGWAWRR